MAAAYDIELRWHGGSELAARGIPPDFRGPSVAALARAIGGDGSIDAATIGRAAAARLPDPIAATGDPPDSHLQQVKYLWHAVLALGHDAA